jgi:hypothetical protein
MFYTNQRKKTNKKQLKVIPNKRKKIFTVQNKRRLKVSKNEKNEGKQKCNKEAIKN